MPLNWTKSSPNNVPEYQLSGVPYVTASVDPGASSVAAGRCPAVVQASNATAAQILLAAAVTPYRVEFPFVTRWVQITNIHASNDLRVGFTANGVRGIGEASQGGPAGTDANAGFIGQNYFVLQAQDGAATPPARPNHTVRLELRCTDLFFVGQGGVSDVSVIAGLTTVHRSQFPVLTGSTYTQATTVNRRNAAGNVVPVQIQAPLFATGSSGLG
ncbi:MAG TPA: hypothetical protein EYG51_15095 [Pseudomonadales bacterium]|nr:hypothetical protein [Pseudomonadales bacterium]